LKADTDAMQDAADTDRQTRATGARRPSRLREYARLMRLDRPIGIWLLLWPVLWALWIASSGRPDERLFVIFVLGTFVMRSAGCVMNDFADREFDPHVRRTADRPLAKQSVSPAEALGLFAVLALIALALVIPLNRPTQVLALIGGVLAVTYPFLKRFFSLPQAYLGAAFGWSVPMAFAAQTGSVPPEAWALFLSVVLWTTAYDTMYAMVDREDDLVIGIRSSAILFGRHDRLVIGALQAGALAGLALVGWLTSLGRWYWAGLLSAAVLAVHQQRLIRHREPAACFRAFLNNNLFGLAVFAGIALDYVFRG
jgi:4-hydroxybenzoate polyprenyltransferase